MLHSPITALNGIAFSLESIDGDHWPTNTINPFWIGRHLADDDMNRVVANWTEWPHYIIVTICRWRDVILCWCTITLRNISTVVTIKTDFFSSESAEQLDQTMLRFLFTRFLLLSFMHLNAQGYILHVDSFIAEHSTIGRRKCSNGWHLFSTFRQLTHFPCASAYFWKLPYSSLSITNLKTTE